MRPHPAVPQTVNWHPSGGFPINNIFSIWGSPLSRHVASLRPVGSAAPPCPLHGLRLGPGRGLTLSVSFRPYPTLSSCTGPVMQSGFQPSSAALDPRPPARLRSLPPYPQSMVARPATACGERRFRPVCLTLCQENVRRLYWCLLLSVAMVSCSCRTGKHQPTPHPPRTQHVPRRQKPTPRIWPIRHGPCL